MRKVWLVVLFLLSCATAKYSEEELFAALAQRDWQRLYSMLEGSTKIEDVISLGVIEHCAGDARSIDTLLEADRLMQEGYTKSIARAAAGAVGNDNAKEYEPSLLEYLGVNAINALNYYNAGNLEDAMVEVRVIGSKLRDTARFTELQESDDDGGLEAEARESYDGQIPLPTKPDSVYADSMFVRYVCYMVERDLGDPNAEVDARALEEAGISVCQGQLTVDGWLEPLCGARFFVPLFPLTPMLAMHSSPKDLEHLGVWATFPYAPPAPALTLPEGAVLIEDFAASRDKIMALRSYAAFKRSCVRGALKKIPLLISAEAAAQVAVNQGADPLVISLACIAAVKTLVAVDASEKPDTRAAWWPRAAWVRCRS